MSGGNIKVVVRCRPLNARELARGATSLVRMSGNQTIITKPAEHKNSKDKEEDVKAFTFDKSYWSADKSDPTFADQAMVYNDLGEDLLDHAFGGYNCCIFAYGQTGSGKSYSMMGYGEDKGIIPRTCSEMFNRINRQTANNLTYRVEVSYIEIYNEKVRDLLNPKNKGNLKVREHPSLGPYVEDLSRVAVNSFADIEHLMDEGNKARTVAATNMNETSSRSHAVFTLFLTQKLQDDLTKLETEKVARISLVDLAGSERANSTGATGQRLKEGANINRSLTTLGKVIAGLAEQSSQDPKKGKKQKEVFIPYRDSVLTWLLKDSLGGNSKTAMVAAISPASDNYEETLSTLRYADQAKRIKNKAVVNEDPNAKLIRELKEELDLLRDKLMVYAPEELEQMAANSSHLKGGTGPLSPTSGGRPLGNMKQEIVIKDQHGIEKKMTREEVIEQLQSSEKLFNELNETWEDKLKKTEQIQLEREKALEELGIAVEKNNVGVYTPKKMPHLVNLNEDPLMSECLMYQIKLGTIRVGRQDSEVPADIRLSGPNIFDNHCHFENVNGIVTLHPNEQSMTMVNGMRISEPRRLRSGYRIILGDYHVFRFNHPEEVRRERDLQKTAVTRRSGTPSDFDDERPESPTSMSENASIGSEVVDWNFAKREAVLNYYNTESNFGGLKDEELEKLFDDITKIRKLRKTRSESRAGECDDDTSSRNSYQNGSSSTNGTLLDDGFESLDTEATIVQADLEERLKLAKEELQQQLDSQKKQYEDKINRMSLQVSPTGSTMLSGLSFGPLSASMEFFTAEQVSAVTKAIQQWKKQRLVIMAETLLTNAAMLKEANIISRELEKNVIYQFTVIDDEQPSNPLSCLETTSALHQFNNDGDTNLVSSEKPCVGIRVLDNRHQAFYTWSLEKLKMQLHQMRNLYNFVDKPQYRKHFNWEDPFYEIPCLKYSFIGRAIVPVRNLAYHRPFSTRANVYCKVTGQVKGTLAVDIHPIARTSMNTSQSTDDTTLRVGQELSFQVHIQELDGLYESEYTQVHVQFKLSSFGSISTHSVAEKLFCTEAVGDFAASAIKFNFSQTISITVTENVKHRILNEPIVFEIYGVAQPRTLAHLELWDAAREKARAVKANGSNASGNINGNSNGKSNKASGNGVGSTNASETGHGAGNANNTHSSNNAVERRSEEELVVAERHDVLAWVQVCELTPDGNYNPTQLLSQNSLDAGVFLLHQGLQRRIYLTLSHTSGRQFPWTRVSKVTIGKVRLLDAKGRIVESPAHEDIPLRLLPQQKVTYLRDGTSTLSIQCIWDSSLHDSLFLNRTTAMSSRILLNLKWEVEATKCLQPVKFNMDIAVQIQGRDSSNPSKLRNLLASHKTLKKCSGIFLVNLRPPMTRKVADLWRLNTASKTLRAEECLGSWQPRGVSLVHDYQRLKTLFSKQKQVALIRQHLVMIENREDDEQAALSLKIANVEVSTDGIYSEKQVELLKNVIKLWRTKPYRCKEMIISQDPPDSSDIPSPDVRKHSRPNSKLIAEVKQVTQSDSISKKGYLMYQENAVEDKWVKKWFCVRRPYIYIYANHSETDEHGVINLASIRIDHQKQVEELLQRSNVFALYTNNNAYLMQAANRQDMVDWISKLDQFYPVDRLI
ncbi:hypothetical protein BC943DRAFT_345926 [Umbelopsis sp. AD052]|nr:hypothetical protein BC943DRAFT_345926 [Umbelopsis sp. AD052]